MSNTGATYTDKRKGVGAVGSTAFNAQLREAVETYLGNQGNKLDRGVTIGELARAGLITINPAYLAGNSRNAIGGIGDGTPGGGSGGGTTIIGGGTAYVPDLTPPPSPTGFVVSAGISYVYAECDPQLYTQGHGHAVSVLYGAKLPGSGVEPTFADAVPLATFSGTVYAYPTDPQTVWYLWLKWMTVDGVESASPAGGVNGLKIVTGQDVRALLNAISSAAQNPTAPYSRVSFRARMFYIANDDSGSSAPVFTVLTAPTTIGGVDVPAGVYFADGYIQNGTITNLKVANGAIDNAKIAAVSADKITAGSIAVGSYIQSSNYVAGVQGWRINGLGTIEANNGIFRGSAYVGDGSLGGILITATAIRSSNYDGLGNGFRLSADGTLDLPGGSVNALQLNVGAGVNLLGNSTWVDVGGASGGGVMPAGWSFGSNEPQRTVSRTRESNPEWIPPGGPEGIVMRAINGPSANVMYIFAQFPVIPGQRYEGSVYCGTHRCTVYTDIEWHDGNGNTIGYSTDGQIVNTDGISVGLGGGTTMASYKRIGHFGVAPNTAAYGVFRIIKTGTTYGTDSYAFLLSPMVGQAKTGQTAFSPYAPTGIGTRVTPQGINTPSLQALTAVLGDVYAGSVRGGSMPGYAWPTDGGGGFYLGPPGLLLGNANLGRYFQVTSEGNFYAPGIRCEWGVLYITQANVINSGNIVVGAVSFGASAAGNNNAGLPINIPNGEAWTIMLVANFGKTDDVSYYAAPNSNFIRHCRLFGAQTEVRQDTLNNPGAGAGLTYSIAPASLTSVVYLGAGSYWLNAWCDYEVYGMNTPIYLSAFCFKR